MSSILAKKLLNRSIFVLISVKCSYIGHNNPILTI